MSEGVQNSVLLTDNLKQSSFWELGLYTQDVERIHSGL